MLRATLVIIVTFLGSTASLFNPFWGMLLYHWYSFFSPLELTYGILDGSRLSLIAGVVFIATTFLHYRKIFIMNALTWLVLIFLIRVILSMAFQHNQTWNSIIYSSEFFVKSILVSIISPIVIINRQYLKYYISFVAVVISFLAFYYGVFGLLAGSQSISGTGRIGDNNVYAAVLVGAWPLTIGLIFAAKAWYAKIISIGLSGGTALAIMLTFSRGGFVALLAVCILLILKIRVKLLIPFLLILGIFGYYAYQTNRIISLEQYSFDRDFRTDNPVQQTIDSFQARMSTLLNKPEEDESGKSRMHFWKVALLMAQDNPVWGIGIDKYQDRFNEYDFSDGLYGENRAVHSLYFLLLAEIGFVGLFLFLLIILICFKYYYSSLRFFRLKYPEQRIEQIISFMPIGLVGFLVASIFVNTFHAEIIWFYITVAISLKKLTNESNESINS
jgi:O-antigen ligase